MFVLLVLLIGSKMRAQDSLSVVRPPDSVALSSVSSGLQGDNVTYNVNSYRSLALHTNFTVPIVRFDINDASSTSSAYGKVSMFNSVGAGINLSYGRVTEKVPTIKTSDDAVERDFANLIAIQGGVLFSVAGDSEEPKNVFSAIIGVTILDFSVGWGYEFGDIPEGLDGHFFTVSYSVPLQKLFNKGYLFIWKKKLENKSNLKSLM